MTPVKPSPVWDVGTLLGEGPLWLPDEQALRFVDIKRGRLHRFDPATGAGETLEVGGKPSFIVPIAGGGLLVGSENRLQRLDRDGLGETLAVVDMPAHNRTNDATVDASGRLWFGTMDDEEEAPTGALYCLDRGALQRTNWAAVITNGPAVSSDCSVLYHVSTLDRTIWRIPVADGALADTGEVFVRIGEDEGYPDGVVLDSEDCLWLALYGGWGVRRYAPDGSLLLHIDFPCANVTKIAFGGPGLTTAYATTARKGLDDAALAGQPLAGSLFAFEAPAPGRVLPPVRLE